MAKLVYTIAEVAEMLGFSEQSIRDWVRSGRIRASRVGIRAWRIPASEVERLMHQFDIPEEESDTSANQNTPGHAAVAA